MNQISSRISVCRSWSLLRKNPLTRWSSSSKPISSFSSSNLTKVFISKLHGHTFIYPSPPPKTPGNHHFRKFSGEASECNFGDDDFLKDEIRKVQSEQWHVPWTIERSYEPSLDAVEDLVDNFNALMEKLGLPSLDGNDKEAEVDEADYPHHLQRFKKEIQDLVESVEMTVAFGEFAAAGGNCRWDHFMENYECMLNYHEILASLKQMKIRSRLMRELIDSGEVFDDDENNENEDMNVAFEEYVAAGRCDNWQPFMGNYRCMINYEEILASLREMKIRSRLMRRLIKVESDFQSTVA